MAERLDQERYEDRLARLTAATERIPPPAGLEDRVMRALTAPRRLGLAEVILLSSRRALVLSAVAAAAAVALGFHMESALDATAASTVLADDAEAAEHLLSLDDLPAVEPEPAP